MEVVEISREERDVYLIPQNFVDTGTILGGTVKLRNAVEAAVLAVGSAVPLFYLPLAFNIRLMIVIAVSVPLGVFGVVGIGGDSLTQFVAHWFHFMKRRRIVTPTPQGNLEANRHRHLRFISKRYRIVYYDDTDTLPHNAQVLQRYRDREYEQEMIYLERAFWHDHILTRIPPPYTEDGSLILESLRRRLGAADKTIPAIQLDNDLSATMLRYLRLQEQKQQVETRVKMLDAEMQRLKGQIVAKLGGSCMAMGEYGGTQYTISYNPVSRTGITKDNLQKMKLLHPDIYDEYVTVSESRRFCIKAKAADEAA